MTNKLIDWPSFGPKRKIRSEWNFISLDEPRFHWLLNADRGWYGQQTPTTHKYAAPEQYDAEDGEDRPGSSKHRPGTTVARSGLISRRGHVRIIREDIGVIERDVMISELKALAKTLLTGRNATIFERRVIGPLEDPHTPRPSIADLAIQFGISEHRVYKILTKSWKKIEKAQRAAQAKEEASNTMATFTAKRSTGGLSFQSDGIFWDANELAKAYSYSTSVNSAASAASTKDIEHDE